jgi:hypothetical protein
LLPNQSHQLSNHLLKIKNHATIKNKGAQTTKIKECEAR